MSRFAIVLAALAALLVCADLAGVIDPPSPEAVIRDVAQRLGPYAYVMVGVLAFLETGAGVGLVAPGELAVILGGVSAGQGQIGLVPLIAVVWACAVAGDLSSYGLGRRFGRGFVSRHGGRVGITPQRLSQAESFLAVHGAKTIILGRFVGLIRPMTPFVAGISRMPARRFIPCTVVAAGVWATTFSLLGYAFWHSLDQLLSVAKSGTLSLTVLLVVGAGAVIVVRRVRSGRRTGGENRPAER
jgi:membrane protein DedA with SNARE-associated domain